MNPDPNTLLFAARADAIPPGKSGLWAIKKIEITEPTPMPHPRLKKYVTLPPRVYTKLFRVTEATMHLRDGECVMEDTDLELKTHLDFMLRAQGNVLITGLGLGCVIRGCLANPNVCHVTCVERDLDVLKLVQPHMPTDRLTIVKADARDWMLQCSNLAAYDCAWHDLWSDKEAGEDHLQVIHSKLLAHGFLSGIKLQGAWNFPRSHRRAWRRLTNIV